MGQIVPLHREVLPRVLREMAPKIQLAAAEARDHRTERRRTARAAADTERGGGGGGGGVSGGGGVNDDEVQNHSRNHPQRHPLAVTKSSPSPSSFPSSIFQISRLEAIAAVGLYALNADDP
jgi:hypothetical protein